MPIRVDAFLSVALMNWCHVIRAQGGCITYEHDDDDDDTYIHTLCLCPDAYYSGWVYTLALRVVAFHIVLMDWCHVIIAQGGCIT